MNWKHCVRWHPSYIPLIFEDEDEVILYVVRVHTNNAFIALKAPDTPKAFIGSEWRVRRQCYLICPLQRKTLVVWCIFVYKLLGKSVDQMPEVVFGFLKPAFTCHSPWFPPMQRMLYVKNSKWISSGPPAVALFNITPCSPPASPSPLSFTPLFHFRITFHTPSLSNPP